MTGSDALGVGARLDRGPARALAESAFAHELAAAPYLLEGLSYADMAHVAMLHHDGVIPPDAAVTVLEALLELHPGATEVPLDPSLGDLYNSRDAFLTDKLGDLAGVIHTGRARREATTLAWQLACRQPAPRPRGERLAGAGRGAPPAWRRPSAPTVMPDFTYLQHAQPTSLGHYLLGFAYPVRPRRRACPAGARV